MHPFPPPPPRPKLAHEQLWAWFQHLRRSGKIIVCSIILFLALSLCICSTTGNANNSQVALPQPTVIATQQPTQQIAPTLPPTPSPTATPQPTPTDTPTPMPTQAPLPPTEAPVQPAPPPVQAPSTGERTGAVCNDGTTSLATGSGACSHHHGVRYWLTN